MIGRIRRAIAAFRHADSRQRWVPSPISIPAPSPASHAGDTFDGRRVLIVGVGPNIGVTIARAFGEAGAQLVLTDVNADALAHAAEALADLGVQLQTRVADVANSRDTDMLLQDLEQADRVPDILVMNAAVQGCPREIGAVTLDDMEHAFRVNVFGHWYLADKLAAALIRRKRRGSFVCVTSIHQRTLLGLPAYSASKAALGMLVRELAVQYAPHGIRINAVAPGWVALDDALELPGHRSTPMYQRAIHPRNVALSVMHLASDALSGQTTGASLTVDGGLSLHSYLTVPPR